MTDTIYMKMNLNMNWTDYRSGIGVNMFSLLLALSLHAPLFFMKLDMHKPVIEKKAGHLLEGIEIIKEIPKPEEKPVPKPEAKKDTWKDKLAKLIKHEPPPPPPPPKLEPKPIDQLKPPPNQIALQPKVDLPKLPQKIESKAGFQASQPKMLEEQKIALKPMNPSIAAPLTAKNVGIQDKGPLKTGKQSFQMASNINVGSIGGGKGLADPNAPTIAIPTGKARNESLSAAPASALSDKGKANFGTASLDPSKNLTLKEKALLQTGSGTQINVGNSRFSSGAPGGEAAGTAVKKDAGSFGGGSFGGVAGGVPGGVVGGTGNSLAGSKGVAPIGSAGSSKPKEKKSMFQITGPLKDRVVEKKVMPEYPVWARDQGVEAAVVLEFTVTPDGFVKDNILTIRSSGYAKLDESAMKALRQWKFKALSDSQEEQVGRITFNYQIF